MRKTQPIAIASREDISLEKALEMLSQIQFRLERLERQLFPGGAENIRATSHRRKGRKSKLEIKVLLDRMSRLTTWLEQNWSHLSGAIRRAEEQCDASIAIAGIRSAKLTGVQGVFQPSFYDEPEKYNHSLEDFLRSGRYHGNPRNLASAMAGLPELSWKRSFDLCSPHAMKTPVGIGAIRDYVRRRFPERFRELIQATSTEEIKKILARSRSQDATYVMLKQNPEQVKEWLAAGKTRK